MMLKKGQLYIAVCTKCGNRYPRKTRHTKLCNECWDKSRKTTWENKTKLNLGYYYKWKNELPKLKHIWVCSCGKYKFKGSMFCIECTKKGLANNSSKKIANRIKKIRGVLE